jgi:hypothetical protein
VGVVTINVASSTYQCGARVIVAKPRERFANALGAIDDCLRAHVDKVSGNLGGDCLQPLLMIADEDRHHEPVNSISQRLGLVVVMEHRCSFAEVGR